ncbi:MAG: ANTAR domain-containing protein [Angustibacter sp.]
MSSADQLDGLEKPDPPQHPSAETGPSDEIDLAAVVDDLAAELLPPGLTVTLTDDVVAPMGSAGETGTLRMPLLVNDTTLGWLVVQADHPEQLRDPDTLAAVSHLASVTALSRHLNQDRHQALRTVDQLHEALTSRASIDMAKGVVIAATRCSPEEAFGVLRQLSQQQNRKLRQVAADVVAAARSGVAVPVLNRGRTDGRAARAPGGGATIADLVDHNARPST